jgi:hypothetical protein
MKSEIKYPLVIVGVALLTMIAFSFLDSMGDVIVKNRATFFEQEKVNILRFLDVRENYNRGESVNVLYSSTSKDDLIKTNKEKIIFYEMINSNSKHKRQLTYPRCISGRSSACMSAEKSFSIPTTWNPGKYKIQIEREIRVDDKAVTEIVGRVFFNVN